MYSSSNWEQSFSLKHLVITALISLDEHVLFAGISTDMTTQAWKHLIPRQNSRSNSSQDRTSNRLIRMQSPTFLSNYTLALVQRKAGKVLEMTY